MRDAETTLPELKKRYKRLMSALEEAKSAKNKAAIEIIEGDLNKLSSEIEKAS